MATNQVLQLEEIQMDYHAFRKDQVLTEMHLNELIRFFEDQDRLTRTCLVGVGLVCGLGIQKQGNQITVSRGCSVTTDGDLLVMNEKDFTHFRKYTNRKKGTDDPIYDPFFPQPEGNQIELWELVSQQENEPLPGDAARLENFNANTGKVLDDQVALQYLEYYLQEPDKCSVIDCDNQGPHQQSQIRILLLSKADMEKVINRDPVDEAIADSIYNKYNKSSTAFFNLPVLKARRVVLNAFNTVGVAALAKAYSGMVQTEGNALVDAIDKLYNAFKFLIDPAGVVNLLQLKQTLQQNLSATPRIYNTQYLYDHYKDIISCYNELRELLFSCISECCPDKYAFPKHIMLGELAITPVQPPLYRHAFYPSPAVSGCSEKIARSKALWQRMLDLIQRFKIPEQPAVVRITPSADYNLPLERRAVPFYYQEVNNLVKNWNYQLSRRGAEKTVLSYHADSYAAGVDSTVNPLDYDLDGNDFFRIEGHLGKTLTEGFRLVNDVKNNKSLPFDVVAIRLDKSGSLRDINPDDFTCQFEDLNAILKAWLVEQNCLYGNIAKFFTGFTTRKDEGFHARIEDFRSAVLAPVAGISVSNLRTAGAFAERTASIRVAAQPQSVATGIGSLLLSKTIYTVDKTITNNLETGKSGTLGQKFAEAIKLPVNTADEVIAEVKRQTANDPNLATLSADEKEVVYEVPITLVANVNQLSALKPTEVVEINSELIEKYIDRMERLCKYARQVHSRMDTIFGKAEYIKRGYETYYSYLLRQLIANCCVGEKLQALLDEVEQRKKKILQSLQLSNYAAAHPGLEHKAGVHRGGTFVMVYAKEQRRPTTGLFRTDLFTNILSLGVGLNANVREAAGAQLSAEAVYKSIDSFAYHLVTNQGKLNFEDEVQQFIKVQGVKPDSLEEERVNKLLVQRVKEMSARLNREEEAAVSDNVLVADFCLPYLCCSDCPPMTFVLPRQQFSLSLPKAAACNDEGQMEFRKDPADGIVKASEGFENTVEHAGGRSFFDPRKVVDADKLGKEISFTINDQVTDCKVTVFKHPAARFEFNVDRETEAVIVVTFTNSSDDDTGKAYVYEWNFSDGGPARRIDVKDPVTITYKKAFLESLGLVGLIPVTLIAFNGSCKSEPFAANVPYTREQRVGLSLPEEVVCNDREPMRFTVLPEDGTVAAPEEPNSVIKQGNEFLFDPRQVQGFGTPISFTVNDRPVDFRVVVFRHPKASFRAASAMVPGTQDVRVTLTNTTDPQNEQQLTYTWSYNLGNPDTTTDTQPFDKHFNIPAMRRLNLADIVVTLRASNKGCSDTTEQRIPIPQEEPPAATCTDKVSQNLDGYIQSLSTPQISRVLVSLRNQPEGRIFLPLFKDITTVVARARDSQAHFRDPAFLSELLRQIGDLLLRMYNSLDNEAINRALLMPSVNVLLKLVLDITRCQPQLSGVVKEGMLSVFNGFTQHFALLRERIPGLDNGKNLSDFYRRYVDSTEHNDNQILGQVKALGTQIADRF